MNNKKEEAKKSNSHATDSCCSSGAGEEQGASLSLKRLLAKTKIFIFIFVMLTAIGVTFISLSKKSNAEGKGCTTNKSNSFNTSQIYKVCPLDSLKSLNTIATNKNFVFILYPGKEKAENDKITKTMEETSKDISKKGVKVGTFAIKKDSSDHKKWIEIYGKDSVPAVVGISKGCWPDIVKGKITKKKLLASYARASKPNPKSSCCPK